MLRGLVLSTQYETHMKSLISATCVTVLAGILLLHGAQPPQTGPATEKRFPPLKVPPGLQGDAFRLRSAHRVSVGHLHRTAARRNFRCHRLHDRPGHATARSRAKSASSKTPTAMATPTRRPSSPRGSTRSRGSRITRVRSVCHARALPFSHCARKPRDSRTWALPSVSICSPAWASSPKTTRSRLHCANGVVVGHDGWLYLALGDNGVNVPRPEGDRLIFTTAAASCAADPMAAICTSSPPACATSTTSPSTPTSTSSRATTKTTAAPT